MPRYDKTGAEVKPFGYALNNQDGIKRSFVRVVPGKDYGADPIGDGTFRMIPSGDIVSKDERNQRLAP